MKDIVETIEKVPDEHHESGVPGFLKPDVSLMFVTWFCFLILLAVLSKYAWKPILAALDAREEHIRKSVEDAQKIKDDLEQLATTQRLMIQEAESQAKEIIENSRKAAVEAAKHISDQAREDAQIILQNAQRDIKEQLKEAQSSLREVSASVAVELASKIIEEHLDESKSKKLIAKYIDEL